MAFAQIPNAGFENWTGNIPNYWVTDNVPGFSAYDVITKSTDSHSGSSAARGEAVDFFGSPYPPILTSSFAVNQRYATFSGYYKFSPVQSDHFLATAVFYKNSMPIASAITEIPAAASAYTRFSVDFIYYSAEVPDTCIIELAIADSNGSDVHVGSTFLADDLSFSGVSGILPAGGSKMPRAFSLEQNYPNPFNPSTTIKFSTPAASTVSLVIYNTLGQEVARLVDRRQMAAGDYSMSWDAAGLPNGIYFYRLTAGQYVRTRKMFLMK